MISLTSWVSQLSWFSQLWWYWWSIPDRLPRVHQFVALNDLLKPRLSFDMTGASGSNPDLIESPRISRPILSNNGIRVGVLLTTNGCSFRSTVYKKTRFAFNPISTLDLLKRLDLSCWVILEYFQDFAILGDTSSRSHPHSLVWTTGNVIGKFVGYFFNGLGLRRVLPRVHSWFFFNRLRKLRRVFSLRGSFTHFAFWTHDRPLFSGWKKSCWPRVVLSLR